MAEPCTVLVAAADLLPALKERASDGHGELLAFTDTDALRALEAITKRRPGVVALERLFAATPRGAALINRIKADPGLTQTEIRVISQDTEIVRVSPRRPPGDADDNGGPAAIAVAAAPAPAAAPPLDQRGTRRALRFRMAGQVDVLLDGNQAILIDLSILGAQVVSPTVLKPNQRIRMSLVDDAGSIRVAAAVAWASFEIPPQSGPRYRAGIEFLDAVPPALEAYCLRHKA